jgi:ATP-dependent Clp protease protease subunit
MNEDEKDDESEENIDGHHQAAGFMGFRRLGLMLDSDIDVVNRTIYIITNIDSSSAETVIKGLDFLSSINHDPITVKITTYGGDPYMGFAIYDAIRKSKCQIKTVAAGACMSAGVLIAAGGDKGHRYADPNCQWMYHAGGEGFDGEVNNFIVTAEHVKDFKVTCIEAITSRGKKRRKFWKDMEDSGSDTYFKSKDAKKYGLIDHITEAF